MPPSTVNLSAPLKILLLLPFSTKTTGAFAIVEAAKGLLIVSLYLDKILYYFYKTLV